MKYKMFTWADTKLYLIVIGLSVLIIAFFQPIFAFIMGIILAYLVYYNSKKIEEKNKELARYVEGLSQNFDSAAKHAIFNMPFPMVFIDNEGKITWYNTPFLTLLGEEEIVNKSISELVDDFNLTELLKKKENESVSIKYMDKYFQVYPNFLEDKKTSGKRKITVLYWVDDTDYVVLRNEHIREKTVVALVDVDNYDDVKNSTPDIHRPIVLAEIDQLINSYFGEYQGIVRKYENDKYMVILNQGGLEAIKSKNFDLMDQVRDMSMGNIIPITLSIGVCQAGETLLDSYENASAAIDIALGRGGDQAVINVGNTFDFYGGKSKAVEKRNKVKARVIGDALRQLIDQNERVFVMGHQNPDMDSIGSSVGIMRAITNRKKEGFIVLNGENPSIRNLMERMRKDSPDMLKSIITGNEASEIMDEKSLLIVLDNHKPSLTEAPELLELTQKVVVIDHHRRGAEFINNPVLTYLEPYASSTAELVTEVLTYMGDETNLTKFEAEALLAGITVDTKNFSFQTGVRTFEAASVLKRAGADTTIVKQLFRDDFSTFVNKAEVIKSSKIIFDRIAIGRLEKQMEDSILIAAQAANELLNINDVEASFVLSQLDEKIHISGRSLGGISVQLILEKLGGGGHLTSAGAQVEKASMKEAEKLLTDIIDKYLKEGEKR
ncbi:DHH family phosphoesterase [Gudongella sp. DL1XJH-153]|uniref:DHH family phosphoesterase n=1 Tax=Gudongella sp. DL1XJH-153 TaxID=3409804 RepID=UPI003BB5C931